MRPNLAGALFLIAGVVVGAGASSALSISLPPIAMAAIFAGTVIASALRERRTAQRARALAEVASKLAAGQLDVDPRTNARDDLTALEGELAKLAATLRNLAVESYAAGQAAREGRRAHRADAERFAGAYREVIEAMNEALAAPLKTRTSGEHRLFAGALNGVLGDLGGAIAEVAAAAAAVAELDEGLREGGYEALATSITATECARWAAVRAGERVLASARAIEGLGAIDARPAVVLRPTRILPPPVPSSLEH